jgi:predicted adenylyl cyclase CyaB
MPRNVEIKARVADLEAARHNAARLSGEPCTLLTQEDTFFQVPKGRLKLRVLSPSEAQLIYYERADRAGPKTSNYFVTPVADPSSLLAVLSAGLGVRGVVRKQRWLYMVGRTRIHLDLVEGLGSFLELEVMLAPEEPEESGRQVAVRLMEALGVRQEDLVQGAYMDLLSSSDAAPEVR